MVCISATAPSALMDTRKVRPTVCRGIGGETSMPGEKRRKLDTRLFHVNAAREPRGKAEAALIRHLRRLLTLPPSSDAPDALTLHVLAVAC